MTTNTTIGNDVHCISSIEDAALVLVLTPANGHTPFDKNATWGQPGLFWGPPGIGKSNRIENVGRMLGIRTEVVYPATQQPEAVSGALVPDGRGGVRIVNMLPGVRRLIEDKAGILFIDELSCARPAVQAAFLGLPIERKVGEDRLPGNVRVLAASNPPDEAAGGWDLEPPMANRFVHLYVGCPKVADWCKWLCEENETCVGKLEDMMQVVANAWRKENSRAKGYVAGFHRKVGYDRNKLLCIPKEGDPNRGRAWPSPRTWEMATRLISTCSILDKPELVEPMVHGCIGKGVGIEFTTWMAEADLPSFEDVLCSKWKPDPLRVDRAAAAYAATTSQVLQEPYSGKKVEYAVSYWKALLSGIDAGMADLVNVAASSLIKHELGGRRGGVTKAAAGPVLTALALKGMAKYV